MTLDAVLEAFRAGDRMEAQRLFDTWYQQRLRESDGAEGSHDRLVLAVQTLEVYAAAGERDMFLLEYVTVQQALDSDSTLPDDVRAELVERLIRAQREAL
jgi:hypothetical protein